MAWHGVAWLGKAWQGVAGRGRARRGEAGHGVARVFMRGTMLIFFLLLWIAFAGGANAHMRDRPDLDEWFKELYSKRGGLCCSQVDSQIIADADWSENGDCEPLPANRGDQLSLICVRVPLAVAGADGQEHVELRWVRVAQLNIVESPNLYGSAMIWPIWGSWVGDVRTVSSIRCFMKGTEG